MTLLFIHACAIVKLTAIGHARKIRSRNHTTDCNNLLEFLDMVYVRQFCCGLWDGCGMVVGWLWDGCGMVVGWFWDVGGK